MKRSIIIILCILLMLSGCGEEEVKNLNSTQGRILLCKDDRIMLIDDKSPIILNVDDLGDVSKFSDGDLVEVWHDAVEESYPARTKAYKIELIEDGDISDIDNEVLKSLSELGWLDFVGETTEQYTICEYKYCRMGIELYDNWYVEVSESESECSIKFRPKSEEEGWVVLQCTTVPFVVCGTGLSLKDTNIGGYAASVAYYDDNGQFSFIRFEVPGEYIIRNVGNAAWYAEYENEINGMLETIILGGSKLTYDEIYSRVDEIVSEYESAEAFFNYFDGTWNVNVYIDSIRYQIKFDNEGNITSELKAIKN